LSAVEASNHDDPDLQWLLGSALNHAGQLQAGVERIERAARRANDAEAYLLAGQTRVELSQYDLAQQDADAVMHLNPALPGAQTLNGMVLEHAGDFAAAEIALRKAIEADPKDFTAEFYLGSILYFSRDMGGATSHLNRALQLRPTSAEARYKLALVARTQGRLQVALSEMQVVARQKPNWIEPHISLSDLYYRLNRDEEGAREKKEVDKLMSAKRSANLTP
jgi:tetratricopeptide (TPR) repeat protein